MQCSNGVDTAEEVNATRKGIVERLASGDGGGMPIAVTPRSSDSQLLSLCCFIVAAPNATKAVVKPW
jgi:hypothetical protein